MKKLLLVLLFPILISAQDTRGRVTGRVTDSSGAVVPAVAVRATNLETNVAVSATTNAQGAYDLPYLLPGVYTLSAEFAGFKKYERDGIAVRVNDQQMKLQFRCEWLNAANHSHFDVPNTTPTNTAFGTITGTVRYPRQVYFALKLLF